MSAALAVEAILADADYVPLDEACAGARRIGAGHGRNAASWCFDGNTQEETYRAVARGLAAGDPITLDLFPEPALGGDYDVRDLHDELDLDYDLTEPGERQAIADAWADAAREAFWHEVERIVAANLA